MLQSLSENVRKRLEFEVDSMEDVYISSRAYSYAYSIHIFEASRARRDAVNSHDGTKMGHRLNAPAL